MFDFTTFKDVNIATGKSKIFLFMKKPKLQNMKVHKT